MTMLRRSLAELLVVALFLSATPAAAHPIHTTYAEIAVDASAVTITVRAFADDLAAAVARANGRLTPPDSSTLPADLERYANQQLQLRDARGQVVPITLCGVRRAGIVTFVCLRASRSAGLTVLNRFLIDRHADQVNIMRFNGGRTLLFSGSSPAQSLLP